MSHRHVCRAGKDTTWCSSAVWWLQGLEVMFVLGFSQDHQLRLPARLYRDNWDYIDYLFIYLLLFFCFVSIEKMSPGEMMPCLHASVFLNSTRGHRGTGRRVTPATPRGTAAHSKLPTTGLTREAQASRARGAAGSPGYRPPLLAVTHDSYNNYVSRILFALE